jgi:hypothetical protein
MKSKVRIGIVLTLSVLMLFGFASLSITSVHAQSCSTVNGDVCSPVGVGFNNLSLFPYLLPALTSTFCPTASSTLGCAPLGLNTTLNIQTSITFAGGTPTAAPFSEVGCSTYGNDAAAFTFQNNFFDPNGEVIQEVLTVGFPSTSTLDPNSGACFTIETNPAGGTQTYDYASVDMSVGAPEIQNPTSLGGICYICPSLNDATLQRFYSAGNSIGFDIISQYDSTTNGATQVMQYILTLNGEKIAAINSSAIESGGGSDSTYHGCNLSQPYECSNTYTTGSVNGTEQNFDVLGNGDGATATFATGNGTISYCGTFPATGLGGVVGYGGGSLEDSDTGYGSLSSTATNCALGPSGSVVYSQPFCMGSTVTPECVAPSSPLPSPEFPIGTILSILAPLGAIALYFAIRTKVRGSIIVR